MLIMKEVYSHKLSELRLVARELMKNLKKKVYYGDLRLEYRKVLSFKVSEKGVDSLTLEERVSGGVRVWKGAFSFASFDSLEKIAESIESAISLSKLYCEDKKLTIAEKVEGEFYYPVEKNPAEVSDGEKKELFKKWVNIALEEMNVKSAIINYIEIHSVRVFANTEGSLISQISPYIIAYGSITAEKENIKETIYCYSCKRDFNKFKDEMEKEIRDKSGYVNKLVLYPRVRTGIYDIVIDPDISGTFAHEAFGHLAEADFHYQNKEMQKVFKKGRKIGNEMISIVDDGSDIAYFGGYYFDDEGVKPEKTYLMKNGEITGRLHTIETATIMGEKPTGNGRITDARFPPVARMSITYIEPGKDKKEDLIASIKNGFYCEGAAGGWTEFTTFTFTPLKVYKVEDGKIKYPVRGVSLQGDIFETLKNVRGVSSELRFVDGWCGKDEQYPLPVSWGGPYLLIEKVRISGD